MTIIEMYENNKEIEELKEKIENHKAVIASGRNVGEGYFKQIKEMQEKLEKMTFYDENQIDEKVHEYEEKVESYEKNNKRMKYLSELIESHQAMVISGRPVSEEYFKQIEQYKEELAGMEAVPDNKIMVYKRELAVAYKEKIKSAPEKNKQYDNLKENIENHKAVIASGRMVGEKYGEQLVNSEKKLSTMKRISNEDIEKWKKLIEEVEKDDKEIDQLKELIDTQQSMMVAGIIGGENAVKKQEELKKQLNERTMSVKEFEELENNKEVIVEKNNEEKVDAEKDIQESQLPAVVKENIFKKAKNKISETWKSLKNRINNFFNNKNVNEKREITESTENSRDTASEYRKELKQQQEEYERTHANENADPTQEQEENFDIPLRNEQDGEER